MKIAVNRAHFPVTVLGPGRRIGIWLQGCSIRCKGCVSQDTWAADAGRQMSVAALLGWCRDTAGRDFDGVTISGGEPFDQPKALAGLLDALRDWREAGQLDFDILCYSGHPLASLQRRHPKLLARLDALIPEPYVDALPMTQAWRGSSNQTLVCLSARGAARYRDFLEAPLAPEDKRMQLMVDGGRVWAIGVPGRGDMAALEAQCRQRGIALQQVSWRAT